MCARVHTYVRVRVRVCVCACDLVFLSLAFTDDLEIEDEVVGSSYNSTIRWCLLFPTKINISMHFLCNLRHTENFQMENSRIKKQ